MVIWISSGSRDFFNGFFLSLHSKVILNVLGLGEGLCSQNALVYHYFPAICDTYLVDMYIYNRHKNPVIDTNLIFLCEDSQKPIERLALNI